MQTGATWDWWADLSSSGHRISGHQILLSSVPAHLADTCQWGWRSEQRWWQCHSTRDWSQSSCQHYCQDQHCQWQHRVRPQHQQQQQQGQHQLSIQSWPLIQMVSVMPRVSEIFSLSSRHSYQVIRVTVEMVYHLYLLLLCLERVSWSWVHESTWLQLCICNIVKLPNVSNVILQLQFNLLFKYFYWSMTNGQFLSMHAERPRFWKRCCYWAHLCNVVDDAQSNQLWKPFLVSEVVHSNLVSMSRNKPNLLCISRSRLDSLSAHHHHLHHHLDSSS